jgi:hypothetical protein
MMCSRVSSREDQGFILIDIKTRQMRKSTDERESRENVGETESSNSKIISKRKTPYIGNARERVKERIEGENKEERREWTTLLNPPLDINPSGGGLTEKRSDRDVTKGAPNKKREPGREVQVPNNVVNPRMVDRVKSLGRVEKKKKPINTFLYTFEKKSVDIKNVVATTSTRQETFLRGVDYI